MAGVLATGRFLRILTAMSLVHFQRMEVDLAVLEVGFGGTSRTRPTSLRRWSRSSPRSVSTILKCWATRSRKSRQEAGIIKPYGLAVGVPRTAGRLDGVREVCVAQQNPNCVRWPPEMVVGSRSPATGGGAFLICIVWLGSNRYSALEIRWPGPIKSSMPPPPSPLRQLQGQGLPTSVDGIRQGEAGAMGRDD